MSCHADAISQLEGTLRGRIQLLAENSSFNLIIIFSLVVVRLHSRYRGGGEFLTYTPKLQQNSRMNARWTTDPDGCQPEFRVTRKNPDGQIGLGFHLRCEFQDPALWCKMGSLYCMYSMHVIPTGASRIYAYVLLLQSTRVVCIRSVHTQYAYYSSFIYYFNSTTSSQYA